MGGSGGGSPSERPGGEVKDDDDVLKRSDRVEGEGDGQGEGDEDEVFDKIEK